MCTQVLHVEFEPQEGAIIRLLGLVERRGYAVQTLKLPMQNKGRFNLEMQLLPREKSRNINVLQRQIERLIGVRRVKNGSQVKNQSLGGRDE